MGIFEHRVHDPPPSYCEVASGESFADSIPREVCGPLELSRTAVITARSDLQDLTTGYSILVSPDGSPVDVRPRYDPRWVATGVIASTASEIARFYHCLFTGRHSSRLTCSERCALWCKRILFIRDSYGLAMVLA